MTVESAQVYRGVLPAARAGQREPRQPGRDGSADRRIEPQGSPARLTRVPDGNDLLSFGGSLALGLCTLGPGRGLGGSTLAVLSSAVRAHRLRHSSLGTASLNHRRPLRAIARNGRSSCSGKRSTEQANALRQAPPDYERTRNNLHVLSTSVVASFCLLMPIVAEYPCRKHQQEKAFPGAAGED
jgi:F0F1-type ATP synthase membrane subunit c/vacuolar-type H+-ATPase subunit K